MSCNYYNDFIRSVHEEIGEGAGYSYEYLAYWFADNVNLGKLNTFLGTCYSASYTIGEYGELVSYKITPDIGSEELSIYQKIFELDFYNKQARNINRGHSAYASSNWTSLKESDSSISKINKKEIAKNYKSISKNTKQELDGLVQSYLKFRARPQQVVSDDYGYYYSSDSPTASPTETPTEKSILTIFGEKLKTIAGDFITLIKNN